MLGYREEIWASIKKSSGMILTIAGLLLMAFGLLNLTMVGSLLFAVGLLFGLMLVISGIILHFDWLPTNIRSKDGMGSLLICLSPFLLASGLICFFVALPDVNAASFIQQTVARGRLKPDAYILQVPYVRIYLWLALLLPASGVIAFVTGLFLRILDDFF